MSHERILVVEDADTLREVIKQVLITEGYAVDAYRTAEEALAQIPNHTYALILSDFKLPEKNGIELLKLTRAITPHLPFILMTAYGSIDIAVQAMKYGANDFITKPFESSSLSSLIKEVISHKRIVDRSLGSRTRRDRSFLTNDPKTKQILNQAKKAAAVETTVLILGESGTGKELIARYIHDHSSRKDECFVAVNCSAIPSELLESEFFGHEAGAYTGATQARAGVLEIASEGTIFLDEIGDMPPQLQVKLLRAIQEREIKRLGASKTIPVSPRIIAATNCDMEEALNSGQIREDFYYRLAVISLELAPLRERPGDIDLLAQYFIEYFGNSAGKPSIALSDVARDMLVHYSWPGNGRELENVIERAVILADNQIMPDHLGINVGIDISALEESTMTLPQIAQMAARKVEIEFITKTLKQTNGNKTRAAHILGVSYKTLLNKIKEYQLGGEEHDVPSVTP